MARTSLPQSIVARDIGLWFLTHRQRRRGVSHLADQLVSIHQPVKQVQHMGLCRHTRFQCHPDGAEHSLFVMLQNQRKDIDHSLPGRRLQSNLPEGAECPWLALMPANHRPLCHDDQLLGVDAQTDRTVRKARWHAVAIKGNQAGR